eukprot:gene921-4181_t
MFRTCPTPQDALFLNLLIEKATLLHQSHIPLTLGSKVIDSEIPSHSHKEKQDAYSCKDHKGSSCCDLLEMCQNDIEEYLKLSQTIHSTSHIDSRTMYHLMETGVPDYLKHAQDVWKSKIDARLALIIREHGFSEEMIVLSDMTAPDIATSREAFLENTTPEPLHPSMFVYDHQDLLREYLNLKNPNMYEDAYAPLGFARVVFDTPTTNNLRHYFSKLHPRYPQIGIVDSTFFVGRGRVTDIEGFKERCTLILASCSSSKAREFCRTGVPTAERPHIWHLACCGYADRTYSMRYDELWNEIRRTRLPVDHLLAADCKYFTNLDDSYFVFYVGDVMLEISIAFTRDKTHRDVLQRLYSYNHLSTWGLPNNNGNISTQLDSGIIPNGVVPFRGLSLLIAPLAFLYPRTPRLYTVFINGILRLSQIFLTLLETHLPQLVLHLQDLGLNPVEIAFPWMFQAFSGFLLVEQVLLLWDRIVGFDSLHVLPVLSFALFALRQRALAKARSRREAEFIMADCRSVAVVPLLQYALFAKEIA